MSINYLDFEEPIAEIENKIDNLDSSYDNKVLEDLKLKLKKTYSKIYNDLTPWQKVQIARHPQRPHTIDYIKTIFKNFILLSGDKKFGDDEAIIAGIATFDDKSLLVLGTEKGNSMETRILHNFGMAKPEGYRKVERFFKFADKFNFPIITFVDTAGAYPGKEAEERGQAEAIARCISVSLKINTPIISVIIGEGGSGGAVALATADKVIMLENSIYSVISPEGCASILWRDPNFVTKAAESLKLTASNCKEFGVIDEIIPELPGGAHRNIQETIKSVEESISRNLSNLLKLKKEDLHKNRNNKFLNITSNIS